MMVAEWFVCGMGIVWYGNAHLSLLEVSIQWQLHGFEVLQCWLALGVRGQSDAADCCGHR